MKLYFFLIELINISVYFYTPIISISIYNVTNVKNHKKLINKYNIFNYNNLLKEAFKFSSPFTDQIIKGAESLNLIANY